MISNLPSDRRDDRPGAASPISEDGHAGHDQLLIARLAGRDVSRADEARARDLVATCAECAVLLADLEAISAAVPVALAVPPRRRDFLLTADDAERLRGSRLAHWIDRARRQRMLLLQPLAAATVTLGLVMAVVSAPGPLPLQGTSDEMSAPTVAAAPGEGAGAVEKGVQEPGAAAVPNEAPPTTAPSAADQGLGSPPPLLSGAAAESPVAVGDGRSGAAASSEPGASVPPPPTGAEPAGAGEAADAEAAAGSGTAFEAAEGVQVPNGNPPAVSEDASPQPSRGTIETWQIWLVVAAAGVLVFVAATVAARRRTSAG